MRLLLDSHILLWVFDEVTRLSGTARAAIEDEDHVLFVSTASLWEQQHKVSRGRLQLQTPLVEMVATLVKQGNCQVLPVFPDHIWNMSTLPWHHNDPFDRLLIAQARVEGLVFVTADDDIKKYGDLVSLLH